jgi:hypothetical protein
MALPQSRPNPFIKKKKKPFEVGVPTPTAPESTSTPTPAPTPAPTPTPKIQTKVKFNPDKSVDYTVGGKTTRLTPAEYQALGGQGGGTSTQAVKDILYQTKVERATAGLAYDTRFAQDVKAKQIEQNPLEAPRELVTPVEAQLAQQQILQPNIPGGTVGEISDAIIGSPLINRAGGQALANFVVSFSSFLPEFAQFGTKKSIGVQKSEQAFSDLSAALTNNIVLVKSGQIPVSVALKDLDAAIVAISDLQSQTKGTGKVNLRYWVDQGREIENQVAREKAVLERQRIELLNAAQEAAITFGV